MSIEFDTPEVERLFESVLDDLKTEFDSIYVSEDVPLFVLPGEDQEVRVVVAPLSEDEAAVRAVSFVAKEVNSFEPGVMEYLLREVAEHPFVRVGIDEDADIFVDMFVHGSVYSADQLFAAVLTVYHTAVRLEHHITLHWGGENKPN